MLISRTRYYRCLEFIVALVLIFAAIMKSGSGGPTSPLKADPLTGTNIIPWLIVTELAMASWLLVGGLDRIRHFCLLSLFTLFASAAAIETLHARPTCGCFGRLTIPPAATCTFDISVVIALHWFGSERNRVIGWRPRFIQSGLMTAIILGASLPIYGMAFAPAATNSRLAIPEPTALVNHRFPLFDSIDGASALQRGRWVVVFYHYDCDDCLAAIPNYRALAASEEGQADPLKVAFIALPPFAPTGKDPVFASSNTLHLSLRRDPEWVAATPIMLVLESGRVRRAVSGDQAVTPATAFDGSD